MPHTTNCGATAPRIRRASMVGELSRLLKCYEDGGIDRRQLLAAMLLLTSGRSAAAQAPSPSFKGRTLNHVAVAVSDFDKSRAFYQKLTGGSVQKEIQNQVDLRVGESFVTVIRGNQPPGIMHFCVGIENCAGDSSMQILQRDFPRSQPRLVTNE